jgi:hypothetical protein
MYREGPAEVKMVKMDPKGATKVNVTKEGVEVNKFSNFSLDLFIQNLNDF